MSKVPTSVHEVLDALVIAEPLETDVLEAIADADALAEAESLGLMSVDPACDPRPCGLLTRCSARSGAPAPCGCNGCAGASPPNWPEKVQQIPAR